jgi:hypothetical protein
LLAACSTKYRMTAAQRYSIPVEAKFTRSDSNGQGTEGKTTAPEM